MRPAPRRAPRGLDAPAFQVLMQALNVRSIRSHAGASTCQLAAAASSPPAALCHAPDRSARTIAVLVCGAPCPRPASSGSLPHPTSPDTLPFKLRLACSTTGAARASRTRRRPSCQAELPINHEFSARCLWDAPFSLETRPGLRSGVAPLAPLRTLRRRPGLALLAGLPTRRRVSHLAQLRRAKPKMQLQAASSCSLQLRRSEWRGARCVSPIARGGRLQ